MENDVDTDDDEMILEGSPLYQYLKEMCPDDGFHSFQSKAKIDDAKLLVGRESSSLTKYFQDASKFIKLWTVRIFSGALFPVDRKEFLTYLNNHALPKHYSLAVGSRRMNEDDAAVLSTLLRVSPELKLSRTKIIFWFFFLCLLMFSHILFLYGIYHPVFLLDAVEALDVPRILMYTVIMTALMFSLVWQVCVVWQYFRLWREHHHQEQSISQFLSIHKSFGDFLKKAVLYVQEVEVILRGYTMMTPFTPISHLERGSQTQLQCPSLRQAIFQVARNQFLSLRQAMLSTLAETPLRDEERRNMDDLYLATTDLQHLAGELSILTDESTGPYPTSYLKAISNLYSDQLSEFIRRHLLCLKSDLLPDSADVTSSWHLTLDSNRTLAEKDLTTLQNCYKLHQPMTPPHSDNDAKVKPRGTQEIWGPSDILPSAVRALRLHLDVTMKSAIQLESKMEDGKPNLADSELHDLEELLSEVKGHLEACQTCVHEAETALTKLTGRTEPLKLKGLEMRKTENKQLKTDIPIPQHLDFISPKDSDIDFIEEEVFEAYIDPEKDDSIPDYSMEDLIEERRKKKQDSEDAKHMLVELHSVLSKREEEKEKMRRERRRRKEGGNSVKEGLTLSELNGELYNVNTERTEDLDGETNIACNELPLVNGLKSERVPAPCGSSDLHLKQTMSHEHSYIQENHTDTVHCQLLPNAVNSSKDSSPETRLPEATDAGDTKRLDDQVTEHQMPLNGFQDVSPRRVGEGFDASGIGKSTETVIKRPVPKPRKNIGRKLNPAREENLASLVPDLNRVSRENGQALLEGSNQGDLEENRRLDPDEENGSGNEDTDGASPWRPQPMAIPFMQGLAAEAVRISRERQCLAEDTFGD